MAALSGNAILDREISYMMAWILASDPQSVVFWRPDQKTEFNNILHLPPTASNLNGKQMGVVATLVGTIVEHMYKMKAENKDISFITAVCGDLSYLGNRDTTKQSMSVNLLILKNPPIPANQAYTLKWDNLDETTKQNVCTVYLVRGS